MATIFRSSDRVKLTIGEITLTLSPLTYGQKIEAGALTRTQKGGVQRVDMAKLAHLFVKCTVKGIKGVQNADKSEFELDFEEKDFEERLGKKTTSVLTDECAEDLIEGLDINPNITLIASQLITKIPDYIEDAGGKKIKGVKLELVGKRKAMKRKKK